MLTCTQCGKPNSLDGRFCNGCGAALPERDLEQAIEDQERLLAEGHRLLNERRIDEARMVAENVLGSNPSSTKALALLGDAHEAEGRLDEALAAYERILELDPDSTLDRIKVAHLRKLLSVRLLQAEAGGDRRTGLVAALAAVVLVASLGAWWALRTPQSPGDDLVEKPSGGIAMEPFRVAANGGSTPSLPPQPNANANPNANATGGGAPDQANANQPETRREAPPIPAADGALRRLPDALPNGVERPLEGEIRPINPLPTGVQITPNAANAKPADPDPQPEPPKPEEKKPVEDPGVIDVRLSKGNPIQRGGSQTSPPAEQGVEALLRVAREHFQLGRYDRAAGALEQALRQGADPGSANQRLAQAYERMGRKADAVAAYGRAIKAYEAATARGGGEHLRDAIATCRQAMRVLQGS